jgi:hypothetical protein
VTSYHGRTWWFSNPWICQSTTQLKSNRFPGSKLAKWSIPPLKEGLFDPASFFWFQILTVYLWDLWSEASKFQSTFRFRLIVRHLLHILRKTKFIRFIIKCVFVSIYLALGILVYFSINLIKLRVGKETTGARWDSLVYHLILDKSPKIDHVNWSYGFELYTNL